MLASDFSGLVWTALMIVAGVACACLFAGALVAGAIVLVTKQQRNWWLTLPLAVIWFAIGWVVSTLLGY